MIAGERDPHGLRRLYYCAAGPWLAPSICELLRRACLPRALDADGVCAFLDDCLGPEQTCVAGVCAVLPGHRLHWQGTHWQQTPCPERPAPTQPLSRLLEEALCAAFARGNAALALSGGLDSALLLALARRVVARPFPVYILDPHLPGYSEADAARATAEYLGVTPIVVPTHERDFVAALPACICHAETPFYNLHPVSKYLLACRLRDDGLERIVTGDGADQVFTGVSGLDYLPLVGALFSACGIELCAPFLDERIVALARRQPPDPDKSALRQLASGLVPVGVVRAAKMPRLAPAIDLSSLVDHRQLDALQRLTGRSPSLASDRERVQWTTLGLLRSVITEDL